MRLHAALHIPTEHWHISNGFSNPNDVQAWIAKQETPADYTAITCAIQGPSWKQVKNSLDYLAMNTCLSTRMEVPATITHQQESPPPPQEQSVFTSPVFQYTKEELAAFADELVALGSKIGKIDQEIAQVTAREKAEDYGSIQSALKTRLLAELHGLRNRYAFVSVQIPPTPVEATLTPAQKIAGLKNK